MVKSIQYFLYCVSSAYAVGVFDLPGRSPDLLFVLLIFFVSIDVFKKSYLAVGKDERIVIYVLLAFMIYYSVIILVHSQATAISTFLFNQRLVFPFFLFFAGLYSIDTNRRLRSFIMLIVICSLVGALLSVAQAMNGKTPLFDSELYAMGHAKDQLRGSAGLASRTMLPVIYLIEPLFLICMLSYFISKRKSILLYGLILLPAVVVGYARSHWVAIIVSALIGYFVLVFTQSHNRKEMVRKGFRFLALSTLVIIVLIYLLDPLLSISDRLYLAYRDVTQFSGNFRARVVSSSLAIAVWLRAPVFGQGAHFMWKTEWYALSDVGVTYTLVTIGLVGLILFSLVLFVLSRYGFRTFRKAIQHENTFKSALGMALFITPICMVLMLTTTQVPYLLSVLSIFALIVVKFNNADLLAWPDAKGELVHPASEESAPE